MKHNKLPSLLWPTLLLVFAVGLWFAWGWYVNSRYPDTEKVDANVAAAAAMRGQFGDLYGGVNALFTALILAGSIYTVWLQHRELENLRKQRAGAELSEARTARLIALAVYVNAKVSLQKARYQMMGDIRRQMDAPEGTQKPYLRETLEDLAAKAGPDLDQVNAIAEDLAKMIAELDRQLPSNAVTKAEV